MAQKKEQQVGCQDDLNRLRKQLKVWESSFFKEHGRKPSNNDIAVSSIESVYREYKRLKQKGSDNKENDMPSDEVFGQFLNKRPITSKPAVRKSPLLPHTQKVRRWTKGNGYKTVIKTDYQSPVGFSDNQSSSGAKLNLELIKTFNDDKVKDISVNCCVRAPPKTVEEDLPPSAAITRPSPRLRHGSGVSGMWLEHIHNTIDFKLSLPQQSHMLNQHKRPYSTNSCFNWLESNEDLDYPQPLNESIMECEVATMPHENIPIQHDCSNVSTSPSSITKEKEEDKITNDYSHNVKTKHDNASISNNFIRLNMKKKQFCRKYNHMTGSKYKRYLWKKYKKRRN